MKAASAYAVGTSGPVLWQVFVLVASVISILLVGASWMPGLSPAVFDLLHDLDLIICGIFFADFIVQVSREPNRWRYLRTWGWVDLLSALPLLAEPYGFGRLARIFRILRIIRVVKTLRLRFRGWRQHPSQVTLFLLGMIILVVVTFSSTAMLIVEERGDGTIQTAGDALWWCMVTLTTVGYGDAVPVTGAGRFIAVVTMMGGIAVFSTFTAFIATTFLSLRQSGERKDLEVIERLERIERRLGGQDGDAGGGGGG